MSNLFSHGPPSINSPLSVRKRDGSVEAFDLTKLRTSIRRALCSGADPSGLDGAAAAGLSEAIHEFLATAALDAPIASVRLLELVETVLTQTGHAAAGMAIRQHAQTRDRHRRWLLVAAPGREGGYVQHRWNKGRLARYLRQQHLLDAPVSRMIAGRVEQLIFTCGLKVVTAGLVREMMYSELLAWGLLPGVLAVRKKRPAGEPRKVKDNLDSA